MGRVRSQVNQTQVFRQRIWKRENEMNHKTITPEELHQLQEKNVRIDVIDVRTPVEFRAMHATKARNIPLDALEPQAVIQSRSSDSVEPIYLMCQAGTRSRLACDKFIREGYENVVSVTGGASAWESANLPVERGKKAISLERQVRIAAGSLVLLGAFLGYFVDPYFIGISAFVGAGLIFAGITDSCGMGMVLAKMPWNKVKADTDETCSTA